MSRSWKAYKKRLSVTTLAGAVAITQWLPFSVGYAASPFADVPNGFWAEPAIRALVSKGIVSGKSKNQFYPNDYLTRAEFATLLVKSLNLPLDQDTTPVFQDVNEDYWAFPYIQTAYKNKLISGISATAFGPNEMITRQDMAVMIANALKVNQVPDSVMGALTFNDTAQISDYAKQAVAASAYLGVLSGYPDRSFQPLDHATRAAAASVINQMIQVPGDKIKELTEPPKENTSPEPPKVEAPKGTVSVFPQTVSLASGATQTFTVTSMDGGGQVLTLPVKWSVGGNIGTIDEQGHFTATAAGTGQVSATVTYPDGTVLANHAQVTVQGAVPEPQQPQQPQPPQSQPQPGNSRTAFSSADYGSVKPAQPVTLTLHVNNNEGQVDQTDNGRKVTLTVTGPDGSQTLQGTTVKGVVNFTVNKTKAGTYSARASIDGVSGNSTTSFKVVPGDAVSVDFHVAPSTFVKPLQNVTLRLNAQDAWGNVIPPTYNIDSSRGTITGSDNPAVSTLVPKNIKGPLTITAQVGNKTVSKQLTVVTEAADLVRGKGDWMMWRDWKNYPANEIINRLKSAGVTHVYLEVSTTSDGFYGKDALDDFLPKAHDAGIVVIGWIYASLSNPWNDAAQTIDVINYTTPSGDQIDGLAADLEENLTAYNIEQFSKGIRDNFGPYYPMIGVVYPVTWRPNLPWGTIAKYYDVLEPMVYWHYKEKTYTYTDAYNAIRDEINAMHQAAGGDKPIHIIGQSYNMFDSWQYPTAEEIKGAMQAAKDGGALGYSTYRGRTATDYEWNQFASFPW